jgi:DNA-binding CsgD family transcriptional regulator
MTGSFGEAKTPGSSLFLRFFAVLALFGGMCVLILALVFSAAGVFSLGQRESAVFLENELAHIAGNIEGRYGSLAAEGVALSRKLSSQIEGELASRGALPEDLKRTPSLIEPVLDGLLESLMAALEKNPASGVFVVLDATVNPALPGAKYSRAGIALQNSEHNASSRAAPSFHYLKGPLEAARKRGLYMRPQWTMEFTLTPGDFWHETVKFAPVDMDVSRLYYWVPVTLAEGDFREVLRLVLPLRSKGGTLLGVCGFDVSDMLFKLQHAPDTAIHQRAFSIFGPVQGGLFDASHSLVAAAWGTRFKLSGALSVNGEGRAIPLFTASGGERYGGFWRAVKMYPSGALHGGQGWALAVLMPQEDLDAYALKGNRRIVVLLPVMLVFIIALAIPLSRRCLAPVYHAIENIKKQGLSRYEKIHIREIDDLFAFLAERDEAAARGGQAVPAPGSPALAARFDGFRKNLATLSRAERAVFNLYAQNHSAKEIAYTLCLSMNTIKTHNKRIYAKLGVGSCNEMMVYVAMMQEGAAPS